MGLQKRLTLLVLLAALPLCALLIWSSLVQQREAVAQATDRLRLSAALVVAGQESLTRATEQFLLAITNTPVAISTDAQRCQRYLDELRGKTPLYANVGILEPDGGIRCQTNPGPTGAANVRDRAYFREVMANRAFSGGDYMIGRVTNKPVLGFGSPVLDPRGDVTGVAFATLDLGVMRESLQRIPLPDDTRVTMLDRNGIVLLAFPSGSDVQGEPAADPVLRGAAASFTDGVARGLDAAGADRFYAYSAISDGGRRMYMVAVSVDRRAVLRGHRLALAVEVVVLALAVGLGALLVRWMGGRYIVGPARSLARAAHRIRSGELDTRLPHGQAEDGDEFDQISGAFNLMAESVQLRDKRHVEDLARVQRAYGLLEMVLNSMREAVLVVDGNGAMLTFNHAAARLFDVDADLPLPQGWPAHYGFFHAGSERLLTVSELPMMRALQGDSGRDLDLDVRNARTGGTRLVRCSFTPLRADGAVVGALTVIADVTDLRDLQAEQARNVARLTEIRRRLLEAQEIGRMGNWELDLTTDRLSWSDEVHDLFGIPVGGFDGSITTVVNAMHPDDRARFMRERDEAMARGEPLETEYRIIRPDGQQRWIHQIGRIYHDDAGRAVRRAGVVQDITARKTAEAELLLLRNAVNRLNDVVAITEAADQPDAGNRMVYVNKAFEHLTGYTAQEVLGTSPGRLRGPDTDPGAMERIRDAMRARRPVREELLAYNKARQTYWLELDITPLVDDSGQVTHFISVGRDITARRQAEQALQVSERRYAALFEQGPIPMWVADVDTGRFLTVNNAALDVYGYTREEFAAMSLYDIRPERERDRLAARLSETQSGSATGTRWTHMRRDGSEFLAHIISRAIPFYGQTALFVAVIDVTAQVQAEKQIQEHVFTLQRAADAAQAIAQHATLQATLQEVVEQARGVVGAHQAVISLSQGADFAQAIHAFSLSDKYARWSTEVLPPPDGSGIYALVCETNRPLRLTQAELEAHPRWRGFGAHAQAHPPMRGWLAVPLVGADRANLGVLQLSDKHDGEFSAQDEYMAIELAHLAVAAIEKAQLIEQVSNLNADLEARIVQRTTELTRQEALFRTLADQAPQLIWMADAQGAVMWVNRYWQELAGGESSDLLGDGWVGYLHPDDLHAVRANWARSRATESLYTGVRRLRTRDGRYHTLAYRAAPVRDTDGQLAFWVGIDADITDLKAYEEALKRSNEELEAFSYSVSHDLRAPLQAVDGFSRLLQRELPQDLGGKPAHYLRRIQAGVARMSQLIEDLLSLAQVLRAQMHVRTVNLSQMARDILDELAVAEPRTGTTTQVQDGLMVQGDARLMRLVMQNLLANAWKFTSRADGARIEFSQDERGVFCVSDNGVGFDMNYADKLFGPFQRLHTDSEFPGTGIGLATVKRIIDRHQGRIWAESGPQGGAAFFFTLHDSTLPPLPPQNSTF